MPNNYETRELDFNSPDGFGRDVAHDDCAVFVLDELGVSDENAD